MSSTELTLRPSTSVILDAPEEIVSLFSKALDRVRDDILENPYLVEALRVLPVGGYRSAIGSVWNAVVNDLRNKIIYRSVGSISPRHDQVVALGRNSRIAPAASSASMTQ